MLSGCALPAWAAFCAAQCNISPRITPEQDKKIPWSVQWIVDNFTSGLIVLFESPKVAQTLKQDRDKMSEQLTQEQAQQAQQIEQIRSEWIRVQFQKANEYLASKGILPESVVVADSRYLTPFFAIWKLNAKDKQTYWVICGDLPTDHMALSAAKDAREAVRAFSLNWQLKAQQIIDSGINDKTKQDFADLLVKRAHGLYEMFENTALWTDTGAA